MNNCFISILFIFFVNYFEIKTRIHQSFYLMSDNKIKGASPLNQVGPSIVLELDNTTTFANNIIEVASPLNQLGLSLGQESVNTSVLASKIEDTCTDTIVFSKNQLRKKRKAEKWEMIKALKKIKKQELSAAKKEIKSTMNSETNHNAEESLTKRSHETEADRLNRKAKEKSDYLSLVKNGFGIVIDCAWEDEHAEKPLKSLVQQILFCYGHNKRSTNPCQFYLTGLGPKVKAQLLKSHYEDWIGVQSTELEYRDAVKEKELIYLTSDATDTLETLEPHFAYIIGGIVDRNRLKGATFKKATEQGIRVAKLPLKEYSNLKSSPVLTVNHVFEILLRYAETKSWTEAFSKVMPERKVCNESESTISALDNNNCNDPPTSQKDKSNVCNETDDEKLETNIYDKDKNNNNEVKI